MSVSRVLVANRGEIAVRIIKACQSLGIETVAAVSEADRESLAAKLASRSVCIGPPRSTDSYLKTATWLRPHRQPVATPFIQDMDFSPSEPSSLKLATTTMSHLSARASKHRFNGRQL